MKRTVILGICALLVLLLLGSVYVGKRINANAERLQMVEAVVKGDLATARRLVEKNPSLVNAHDRDRLGIFPEPVVNIAVRLEHKQMVEFLIREGAHTDGKATLMGFTPLHWAAGWGDADILNLLLQKGAEINADNGGGGTPIVYAVYEGQEQAVDLLKEHGAIPGSRIHEGAAFGDIQIVREEVEREPGLVNSKEWSNRPLDLAAKHGHADVVSFLIDNGASVSPPALTMGAESGQLDIVELLVARGADVNGKKDDLGFTPLHAAAENGHLAVARYLLAHSADPDIKSQGYTPLELAEERGHVEIANLLRSHMKSKQ